MENGKSGYGLDLSVADNRIVDEALSYAASNPGVDLVFLSHDTAPILTAKRHGLPVFVIPDGWLLPPEPDPRDKRIMELERKVGDSNVRCHKLS